MAIQNTVARHTLLENIGYFVLTANGESWPDVFSAEIVNAAFLNPAMPHMNGDTFAAQLRRMNSEIPLIVVSDHPTNPAEDLIIRSFYMVSRRLHAMQRPSAHPRDYNEWICGQLPHV